MVSWPYELRFEDGEVDLSVDDYPGFGRRLTLTVTDVDPESMDLGTALLTEREAKQLLVALTEVIKRWEDG